MIILKIWSIYSSFHFITYKENHVFHNFFRVNYSICAYIVRFMLFFIHMILLYGRTHVTVCVTNDWLKQSLPTPAMHDDFYHKPYWQSPKDCGVPSLKILKYVTKSWGKIMREILRGNHEGKSWGEILRGNPKGKSWGEILRGNPKGNS